MPLFDIKNSVTFAGPLSLQNAFYCIETHHIKPMAKYQYVTCAILAEMEFSHLEMSVDFNIYTHKTLVDCMMTHI